MSFSEGSRHPAGVFERRIDSFRCAQEMCFHWITLISHARMPQKKSSVAATYAKTHAGFEMLDQAGDYFRVCMAEGW
jgi:hypothetical protein